MSEMINKIADEIMQMLQETAEATIKAIAEPTREMIEAGKAIIIADVLSTKPADMLAAEVWRAMHERIFPIYQNSDKSLE